MDPEKQRQLGESFGNRNSPVLIANAMFKWPFDGINSQMLKYKVITYPNRQKIGFVGMYTHDSPLGYRFGPSIFEHIDKLSTLTSVFDGNYSTEGLKVNLTRLLSDAATGNWDRGMNSHDSDVYRLATQVCVDVLAAAESVKREHPDVDALVLLATNGQRPDVFRWLLQFGPFDVIVHAQKDNTKEPQFVESSVYGKRRILVPAPWTKRGLGHLMVRINRSRGVDDYKLEAEILLGSDITENATASQRASEFYASTRARNAKPFGYITKPLTGGHRAGETPPSLGQCYYTDCPGGDHLGRALLWRARSRGLKADVSLYNLGDTPTIAN